MANPRSGDPVHSGVATLKAAISSGAIAAAATALLPVAAAIGGAALIGRRSGPRHGHKKGGPKPASVGR
jgi:hypothetical protein